MIGNYLNGGTHMKEVIYEKLDQLYTEMVDIRRFLHQHPELSFEEVETLAYIAEYHRKLGHEVRTGVGKRGVWPRFVEVNRVKRSRFGETQFKEEDDYTVTVEVEEPTILDIYVLADMTQFAAIMPKDIIENAGTDGVEEIVGTGPYFLEEWQQDHYIHLKKFIDYKSRTESSDGLSGEKKAFLDDIYFHILTDSSTRIAGLQSGEYDLAVDVPHDVAES